MLTIASVNDSVLDLIGNTPLVDVSALSPNPDVRILAKLESQNPFGSVKDRIAKAMIEDAEKHGHLHPGQTIVEPSSGNTGIALAAIARIKGYPIKILLPENVSIERRQMLEVFGAEIILTPGAEGSNGAVRRAEALAAEHPEWCFLYQYGNDANPRAHYEGTGPEIWRDCPEITHFVAGLGTSGTLMGTGRFLKEQNPDIKIDRHRAAARRAGRGPAQPRRGLHPAGVRAVGRPATCSTASASCGPRSRSSGPAGWSSIGVFAGLSAGAALAGAVKVAAEIDRGTIVFIVSDGGWKYLSTGAYTDDLDAAEAAAEQVIYF